MIAASPHPLKAASQPASPFGAASPPQKSPLQQIPSAANLLRITYSYLGGGGGGSGWHAYAHPYLAGKIDCHPSARKERVGGARKRAKKAEGRKGKKKKEKRYSHYLYWMHSDSQRVSRAFGTLLRTHSAYLPRPCCCRLGRKRSKKNPYQAITHPQSLLWAKCRVAGR